jgi:hypothetical protein
MSEKALDCADYQMAKIGSVNGDKVYSLPAQRAKKRVKSRKQGCSNNEPQPKITRNKS